MNVASLCGPTCGAPLFVHVLGATLLFGALLAVTTLGFASIRIVEHGPLLRRLAFTIMLAGVWPSYILMRVGAQWVLSHEGLDNDPPGWVGVGFLVSRRRHPRPPRADAARAGSALRRRRAGAGSRASPPSTSSALGVAVFAMSAKTGL